MLVHICCSVDSHYFLTKLKELYPNEKLIGFFYDPNIHPYSEYYLRLLDVKRSCKILGVKLIEGEYDINGWLNSVRGYEDEPEKGKRCSICFEHRFLKSAQVAKELNQKSFTSTLLTSPKKDLNQLKKEGEEIAKRFGLEFISIDLRKKGGTQEQNIMAKEAKLYRQDYCGCLFALSKQRKNQKKYSAELISPISNQILPQSIEDKISLYKKRLELEEQNIEYKIVKERFLNYRVLRGYIKEKDKIIPSHIIPYSIIKNGYSRGRVEFIDNEIGYFNRDEIKFITLKKYNKILNKKYKNIKELIFNPPSFNEELIIREKILNSPYSLSAIFVVEEIPKKKLEIFLKTQSYEDIRERLIILK